MPYYFTRENKNFADAFRLMDVCFVVDLSKEKTFALHSIDETMAKIKEDFKNLKREKDTADSRKTSRLFTKNIGCLYLIFTQTKIKNQRVSKTKSTSLEKKSGYF